MRVLGRVEELQRQMQMDFADEKREAHDSRSSLHRRLDEQGHQIGLLDKSAALSGMVDVQIRDELTALKDTVAENHAAVRPALDEWSRLKALGYGISGLIAFAGLVVGGFVSWASDGALSAIKHWLRIP